VSKFAAGAPAGFFHKDGRRELVPMRWGLIPRWWSKTIKDAKMATFNARAETI
jgi:putative SOS response-associated peptidase YedK